MAMSNDTEALRVLAHAAMAAAGPAAADGADAALVLADGTVFWGKGAGAPSVPSTNGGAAN